MQDNQATSPIGIACKLCSASVSTSTYRWQETVIVVNGCNAACTDVLYNDRADLPA
jgi:hypothetical protein